MFTIKINFYQIDDKNQLRLVTNHVYLQTCYYEVKAACDRK